MKKNIHCCKQCKVNRNTILKYISILQNISLAEITTKKLLDKLVNR